MKEKAKELVDRFYFEPNFSRYHSKDSEYQKIAAKKCALICVDEILKIQPLRSTKMDAKMDRYSESDSAEYWQEVKQEIEKL